MHSRQRVWQLGRNFGFRISESNSHKFTDFLTPVDLPVGFGMGSRDFTVLNATLHVLPYILRLVSVIGTITVISAITIVVWFN